MSDVDLSAADVDAIVKMGYNSVNVLAQSLNGTNFSDSISALAKPEDMNQFVTNFAPQAAGILGDFSGVIKGGNEEEMSRLFTGIHDEATPDRIMQALSTFGSGMYDLSNMGQSLDVENVDPSMRDALGGAKMLGGKGLETFSALYPMIEPLQKSMERNIIQQAVKEGVPAAGAAIDDVLTSQGIPTCGAVQQISTALTPIVGNLANKGIDLGHEVGKKAISNAGKDLQGNGDSSEPLLSGGELQRFIPDEDSLMGMVSDFSDNPSEMSGLGGGGAPKPMVMSDAGHMASDTSLDLNTMVQHGVECLSKGLAGTDLGNTASEIAGSITEHTTPDELANYQETMNGALKLHNDQFTEQVDDKFGPGHTEDSEHQLDIFQNLKPAPGQEQPNIGQVVNAFKDYLDHYQAVNKKIDEAEGIPEKLKVGVLGTVHLSAQALEDERKLATPVLQVVAPIATQIGIQVGLPALDAAIGESDGAALTVLSPMLSAAGGAASRTLVSAASNMSHVALEKVKKHTADEIGIDGGAGLKEHKKHDRAENKMVARPNPFSDPKNPFG